MATVLLIDESLDSGSIISDILDKAGYNVVLTIEPARALELCSDINFDVILCDLCLREKPHKKAGSLLTGMDTLWRLVDQNPKLPIVAMSKHLDQSTLEAIKKLGVFGAVSHPLESRNILEVVEAALVRYEPAERVAM